MAFERGQWVRHPKCPEWGAGEVVEQDGDKLRVIFSAVGEKRLDLDYVALELADAPPNSASYFSSFRSLPALDLKRLEKLCSEFHEEMKDNRPNSDDGKMALNVLEDVKRNGDLSRATRRQLLAWCHTDGFLYQRGVDMARRICNEIFGRVPTREEARRL